MQRDTPSIRRRRNGEEERRAGPPSAYDMEDRACGLCASAPTVAAVANNLPEAVEPP